MSEGPSLSDEAFGIKLSGIVGMAENTTESRNTVDNVFNEFEFYLRMILGLFI